MVHGSVFNGRTAAKVWHWKVNLFHEKRQRKDCSFQLQKWNYHTASSVLHLTVKQWQRLNLSLKCCFLSEMMFRLLGRCSVSLRWCPVSPQFQLAWKVMRLPIAALDTLQTKSQCLEAQLLFSPLCHFFLPVRPAPALNLKRIMSPSSTI